MALADKHSSLLGKFINNLSGKWSAVNMSPGDKHSSLLSKVDFETSLVFVGETRSLP